MGSFAALLACLARSLPASADPRVDYMLHCRGCHGPDGNGIADGGAPPFRGELGRFLAAPGGRAYLVRVPGAAQSELSDAGLAELLNWLVRAFDAEEVPREFAPYGAEEVARYRAAPLSEVEATRRELLRSIEPPER
jgi:mono/diheme cytochrome c family protein